MKESRIKTILNITQRLSHPFWWHNLRRLKPVSNLYGLNRGQAVDRYYIEKFLNNNKRVIKGKVLEIADGIYTSFYGGSKVTHLTILDIDKSNSLATVYDDLRNLKKLHVDTYDCVILTQVLQFIDDHEKAVKEIYRILKPGGTVLVTLPSLSRVDVAAGIQGDFWRYTKASAKYLFEPIFGNNNTTILSFGNVLSGTAFWQGIALEELSSRELEYNDPNFPLVITVKATKKIRHKSQNAKKYPTNRTRKR